jgi:hypothetical protein
MKMLSQSQREKLIRSWGEKADAMSCMAEVRVYDPLSPWECYIYDMNPEDEDEVLAIVAGFTIEVTAFNMKELMLMFNSDGDPLSIDNNYRPRTVMEIFNILRKRHGFN